MLYVALQVYNYYGCTHRLCELYMLRYVCLYALIHYDVDSCVRNHIYVAIYI